jgi:hypothetical protein
LSYILCFLHNLLQIMEISILNFNYMNCEATIKSIIELYWLEYINLL